MSFNKEMALRWARDLGIQKHSALELLIHMIKTCDDEGRLQKTLVNITSEMPYCESTIHSNLTYLFLTGRINKMQGYRSEERLAPAPNIYVILFDGDDEDGPLAA